MEARFEITGDLTVYFRYERKVLRCIAPVAVVLDQVYEALVVWNLEVLGCESSVEAIVFAGHFYDARSVAFAVLADEHLHSPECRPTPRAERLVL